MAVLQLRLFDIPWEQVLCKHLLPLLSVKELFCLRGISTDFRDLIDCHFSLVFRVNTSQFSTSFSCIAFDVLTRKNCCLKELILHNARDWLSDTNLIPVIQNNPNLQKVDLSNCLNISNSSLYSIGAHCRKLQTLIVRGCVWVSSAGLISLITNRLPLEHVDLCGCWDLNDDDIINMAMDCREIKYLVLNNIYGLTDRCISQLAHFCPGLVQLSVQGCWRLTDHAIYLLGEYCTNLRALQVRECPKVTEMSLAKLRAQKVRIDKSPPPASVLHWMGAECRPLNVQI